MGDGLCSDSNGRCTLRAAIEESNYEPVANVNSLNLIVFALPNPAVIDLTLGELNVTSGIWIFGTGARRLTVQRSFAPGTANFRVFRIASGNGGVEIRRMSIRNGNSGSGNGGGILVEANSGVSISDVAITANSAANGGGIANASRSLFMNRVLVNSNIASVTGGGISNQGFFGPTMTNSTITNNSASVGGAIYNTGSIWLANDTISHNAATDAARGIFNESGSINVLNTIIGSDDASTPASLSGAFISKGNNIVTDARNSTGFTNGVNNDQVSENNAINPLLGILTDNGGHTDTRALLAGSPAIDAGNNCVVADTCESAPRIDQLASDQRGRYFRKVGAAVDIGAFEAGAGPPIENISFGLIPGPGRPALFSGAVAVLTSATTKKKIYGAVNPFGAFRFQNVASDFYILEIRGKRAVIGGGPIPIGLDEIPFGFPTDQLSTAGKFADFRFIVEHGPK
ncbi:MAG: right-handed parallel beta-helix repeat-containing protein [Acidobacteria bacterium]|nr:right-handed parallel beta-helix repeat-containing protein [Acidobacteriota bacterium]